MLHVVEIPPKPLVLTVVLARCCIAMVVVDVKMKVCRKCEVVAP